MTIGLKYASELPGIIVLCRDTNLSRVSGDSIEFRFPAMALPLEDGNFAEFSAELDMNSEIKLSDIVITPGSHDNAIVDGRKAVIKKKIQSPLTEDLIVRIQVWH